LYAGDSYKTPPLPLLSPAPFSTIKKHTTGKGSADKLAVIKAFQALGFNPKDDNEAEESWFKESCRLRWLLRKH
jgi:hypothetical protein